MKTIKIPKVQGDKNDTYSVKFYRSKSRKYTIYLQEQEIAGMVVPKDTEINIDWESYYTTIYSTIDEIQIPVYYINRMLKFVYLEKLRNGTERKSI